MSLKEESLIFKDIVRVEMIKQERKNLYVNGG
jgi:hypothetical protein